MESIFALSPISSSRRVRRSSFTSLSALANQNAIQYGGHMSSPVSLPSEAVKRIRTLFPIVHHLQMKEPIEKINRHIMPSMAFRSVDETGQDFFTYRGCSMAVLEAVRLLHNSARFAKASHQLSTRKDKTVSNSQPQPPLVRPLHGRAESGKWARRVVETINKTLINGPDRIGSANSKTIDDIVHDFLGLELEMDRQGNVVPTFLPPLKSSKYDIYNRRRFNENLIFELEK